MRLDLVVDYLDHAAFESLHTWQQAHESAGGTVEVDEIGHPRFANGKQGRPTRDRRAGAGFVPRWLAPWSDWQAGDGADRATHRGATEFQRRAAPLLRDTLSGLADGQQPRTLFITCGDSPKPAPAVRSRSPSPAGSRLAKVTAWPCGTSCSSWKTCAGTRSSRPRNGRAPCS